MESKLSEVLSLFQIGELNKAKKSMMKDIKNFILTFLIKNI